MKKMFEKGNYYNSLSNIKSNRIICGWCDSIISPNKGYQVDSQYSLYSNEESATGYIYVCPNCNQLIMFNSMTRETFPSNKFGRQINKLPLEIEQIYNEIRECYAVNAYTSVVLLARKLLMHIGVQEGAEENKKFIYYVDYLNDNHLVPPKSKGILDIIRKEGNEANHEIVIKTKEGAEHIISLVEIILLFLYEFAD